ncbi:PAN domain-containing At5g03700 [Olea europaea subsp. europaea]|uniref:PAN domain-containing At5g03700 n=1 Tax=Olea europaea subsp. europaea TaxID=158383 RepID=A0A8S0RWN5_OLEEU|nr:PAN domain-containing At5g03700 [Olea europaea subsp. europaea]
MDRSGFHLNSGSQILLLTSFFVLCISNWWSSAAEASTVPQKLLKGFKATPNPSISSFQPLLSDSTGNYSLGFLRVNKNQLNLAVLHIQSSEQLWYARTTRLPRWAHSTELFFNGSLVLSDPHKGVLWSTQTDGDRVWLSNTSNLQIQKLDDVAVLWQSFDFPSDTLVENQNFTSAMTLVSSNGLYSMRLGSDFIGLYAKFNPGTDPGQIYLKHRALEAKARIVKGQGPIHIILMSDGYLGMFQTGSTPVDVQSFNSFQQNVSGTRRVRIEPDGNLKGYFWAGSSWIVDYQAISEPCELPSPCGSYGLCQPGKGCSCLDNRTEPVSGGCVSSENHISVDLCRAYDNKYKVLRRSGVELPYKELMGYKKMESITQCESACELNCTCWGAVYSNSSGFCYMLDYPMQTLVAVADETKMGYFKLREGPGKKKVDTWLGLGLGLLFGAILVFGGVIGLVWYKLRSKRVKRYVEEEGIGVGPYKDLGAASFRSIELCEK